MGWLREAPGLVLEPGGPGPIARRETDRRRLIHGWNSAVCGGPSPPRRHRPPGRAFPRGGQGAFGLPPGDPPADLAGPGRRDPDRDRRHPLRPPDASRSTWSRPGSRSSRRRSTRPSPSIVTRGELGQGDASDEKYIPDTLAMLNDKSLAEEVVRDPRLGLPASALEGDPAAELTAKVKTARSPSRTSTTSPSKAGTPTGSPGRSTSSSTNSANGPTRESRDASDKAQSHASGMEKRLDLELDKHPGRPHQPHQDQHQPGPGRQEPDGGPLRHPAAAPGVPAAAGDLAPHARPSSRRCARPPPPRATRASRPEDRRARGGQEELREEAREGQADRASTPPTPPSRMAKKTPGDRGRPRRAPEPAGRSRGRLGRRGLPERSSTGPARTSRRPKASSAPSWPR